MKIYVVTSGEYSDYHIEAVFDSLEQAEIYCAVHDNIYTYVEEYDTEHNILCTDKVIKKTWYANMRDNEIDNLYFQYAFDEFNIVRYDSFYKCYQVIVTLDKNTPEEKVEKIIYDRYAKWKYECSKLKRSDNNAE